RGFRVRYLVLVFGPFAWLAVAGPVGFLTMVRVLLGVPPTPRHPALDGRDERFIAVVMLTLLSVVAGFGIVLACTDGGLIGWLVLVAGGVIFGSLISAFWTLAYPNRLTEWGIPTVGAVIEYCER